MSSMSTDCGDTTGRGTTPRINLGNQQPTKKRGVSRIETGSSAIDVIWTSDEGTEVYNFPALADVPGTSQEMDDDEGRQRADTQQVDDEGKASVKGYMKIIMY